MNTPFETKSADKLAFIAWLAGEFGVENQLGKKALQKLVHIAEEGLRIPTGYTFSLYTYGAFSRDLAGDLDIVKSIGGIEIEYISAENRYIVSPGKRRSDTMARAEVFLKTTEKKLDLLKENFSGAPARYLELFSTLLFFLKRRNENEDDNVLIQQLLMLKPKYSPEEAAKALVEVKKFLETAKAA
ncbi:hypothetical protein [Microvirga thermotolerans]|uniref:Uncharacterized protein n=1 Tax=Microvirga thermotolerans TaxID=2651334 RepID=A0A5P9JZ86_9HYPH|nr:hypothetical protein [Microvirga thermotolerans]QFU16575.1 hypothetical protein GDR74_10235 [Microvirga thermotolerans]